VIGLSGKALPNLYWLLGLGASREAVQINCSRAQSVALVPHCDRPLFGAWTNWSASGHPHGFPLRSTRSTSPQNGLNRMCPSWATVAGTSGRSHPLPARAPMGCPTRFQRRPEPGAGNLRSRRSLFVPIAELPGIRRQGIRRNLGPGGRSAGHKGAQQGRQRRRSVVVLPQRHLLRYSRDLRGRPGSAARPGLRRQRAVAAGQR
jgi:hypothetical protein